MLLDRARYVFCIASVAAMLAGCGASQSALSPWVTQGSQSRSPSGALSSSYKVVFSFDNLDGASPYTELTKVGSGFDGTTYSGGSNGEGTIFSVTTSGHQHVLHSFQGTDGANPAGRLHALNGVLYGVTLAGGAHGFGTVFRVAPNGAVHTLYSFKGGLDGANPSGELIVVNGQLFGTTQHGGAGNGTACNNQGCGTVFQMSTSGVKSLVHNFLGGADGAVPEAGLTAVSGTLYGTTFAGGLNNIKSNGGTVFSVLPTGDEHELYAFHGGPHDGFQPAAALTNVNGTLYGTTTAGGRNNNGAIFTITTAGSEQVLHDFKDATKGAQPYAALTNANGALYGTTFAGGSPSNAGTVFSITTAGQWQLIHSFAGGKDGANPRAGLIELKSHLYGTTTSGGTHRPGYGTVFAVAP
jgi:uncharacterized repeat protein (TIGR03803 family)